MGGRYSIFARNYKDDFWQVSAFTNYKIEALIVWIKALRKYELVEFTVRK